MNRIATATFLLLAAVTGRTLADDNASKPHVHEHTTAAASATADVPAAARDAVAAVERFSAALSAGRLEAAGAELDTKVLILESGGAERSAAEYLGGHAKSDAAFLKGVHVQLMHRTARVAGDLVWVASESELHLSKDGNPVTMLSTETMLVQRTGTAWKIVHIHWSSRTKKPAATN